MTNKTKIKKNENEMLIDYLREKQKDELRYSVLEFLVNDSGKEVILYFDTNAKMKSLPIERVKQVLEDLNIEYLSEPVESTKRGVLGFGQLFKPKKKEKRYPENIVIAELSKEINLKKLYDEILSNFDYALGINSHKPISELILRLKNDVLDILFNKEIFENTIYDSVFIGRIRIDAPYGFLFDFLNGK